MLSEAIKKLSKQTNDSSDPMMIVYGDVKSSSPLQILVDNRFPIEGEAIIIMQGTTVSSGDKVVMLRNHGGQQFLVLGRV